MPELAVQSGCDDSESDTAKCCLKKNVSQTQSGTLNQIINHISLERKRTRSADAWPRRHVRQFFTYSEMLISVSKYVI